MPSSHNGNHHQLLLACLVFRVDVRNGRAITCLAPNMNPNLPLVCVRKWDDDWTIPTMQRWCFVPPAKAQVGWNLSAGTGLNRRGSLCPRHAFRSYYGAYGVGRNWRICEPVSRPMVESKPTSKSFNLYLAAGVTSAEKQMGNVNNTSAHQDFNKSRSRFNLPTLRSEWVKSVVSDKTKPSGPRVWCPEVFLTSRKTNTMSEPKEYSAEQIVNTYAAIVAKMMIENSARFPGRVFRIMLVRAFFNMMATMPEDYWQQFQEVIPCGKENCDCHVSCNLMVDFCKQARKKGMQFYSHLVSKS